MRSPHSISRLESARIGIYSVVGTGTEVRESPVGQGVVRRPGNQGIGQYSEVSNCPFVAFTLQ